MAEEHGYSTESASNNRFGIWPLGGCILLAPCPHDSFAGPQITNVSKGGASQSNRNWNAPVPKSWTGDRAVGQSPI